MRKLSLPFFAVWLLISNVVSIGNIFIEAVLPATTLPLLAIMVAAIIGVNQHQLQQTDWKITSLPNFSVMTEITQLPLPFRPYVEQVIFQRSFQLTTTNRLFLLEKLDQNPTWPVETAYWQSVLAQQPTDKNVLLNLSELALFEGKVEHSQQLRKEAQKLDPNNPIFIQPQLQE